MKKFFGIMIVAAALLMTLPAHAQFKYGFRAGANLTSVSLSRDILNKSNRTGFYVGPTIKFNVPVVGLGVDASALYDQKSLKVGDESFTSRTISIPINARYGWGIGSMANIFLFTGPQFAFNVGSDKELKLAGMDTKWQWKSSNFSWNVGVGATVLSHVEVKANYNIACGKTGSINFEDGISGKYNAWQIGAAYWF